MTYLIWIGAALTALGMAGILYCAAQIMRAKRENLSNEALQARIQGVMPINLAALFISAIGLMGVVVGILLSQG